MFISVLIISAILVTILLFLLLLVIIWLKWEAIKLKMFIKFGIQFKDEDEQKENLKKMDYDAFVNYR